MQNQTSPSSKSIRKARLKAARAKYFKMLEEAWIDTQIELHELGIFYAQGLGTTRSCDVRFGASR